MRKGKSLSKSRSRRRSRIRSRIRSRSRSRMNLTCSLAQPGISPLSNLASKFSSLSPMSASRSSRGLGEGNVVEVDGKGVKVGDTDLVLVIKLQR